MKKTSITSFEGQSSAEIVASIDGLLIEILLHLPLKQLVRFKLISKHWNSLISDPGFCIRRNPDPNPAVGLFLRVTTPSPSSDFWTRNLWDEYEYEYVSFSGIKSNNPQFGKSKSINFTFVDVLQSCNGLLLCHDFRGIHYVYNPTTNRFSMLKEPDGGGGMCLAFDPVRSPHYKVVCIRRSGHDVMVYQYQFEVYSSQSCAWKKCGQPFFEEINLENAVYWNGSIHWIDICGTGEDSLFFNIDDEILRVMPLPPVSSGFVWGISLRFLESCGHLHYVINVDGEPLRFDVYEMRRDYSEWFVKYEIDLSPLVAAYPEMTKSNIDQTDQETAHIYDMFSLVRGVKEEDSFLFLQIPGKVIWYNIVYRTFGTKYELPDYKDVKGPLRFPEIKGFQYIESLCRV